MRADLKFLATELPARHIAPFHRVSRRSFERQVAALDRRMSQGIDADTAYVGMSRIVSAIGDGHTLMPDPDETPLLGLRFARFGRDYRLIEAVAGSAGEAVLGGRLTKVGETPIAIAEQRLMALTPGDETRTLRESRIGALLDRGIVLHGLGLSRDRNTASFTFVTDDGRAQRIAARATEESEARWASAARGEPLSARAAGQAMPCARADTRTLYCNFRSYRGLDMSAAKLFDTIDHTRPARLIVDLRQNGGGDYCAGLGYLIRPLAARPELNRPGRLYVLIGPETFSAAMSNAAHFRQLTQAVLVGQPIGEIPNSYQEVREFTLPNSRWTVHYSKLFYRFAPGGKNLIEPDMFVARTWSDYRKGKDAVVDWVLAQPLTGTRPPQPLLAPGAKAAEENTCRGAP